jgi:hypothetical protein
VTTPLLLVMMLMGGSNIRSPPTLPFSPDEELLRCRYA